MATIVNNPPPGERVVERDSGAGWAVGLIIILALVIGLFVWARYYNSPNGANVNVTVPNTGTTNSSGTAGGTSGTSGSGASTGSGGTTGSY